MITIPSNIRNKYMEGQGTKKLLLSFPELGLTVTNSNIITESMALTESLFDGDSIEWVGCISSVFEIELKDITQDLKDKRIIVTIDTDNDNHPIRLFTGYVDSVTNRIADHYKKIVCYDDLYYLANNVDIAEHYNSFEFPLSLEFMRKGLLGFLHIDQEDVTLPSDGLFVDRQYQPTTMPALDTIKHICQCNGKFGIFGRDGKFHYKDIGKTSVENISYYKSMEYEDYVIDAVDGVLVRDDEQDPGIGYGAGRNVYIIQGNIWSYGLDDETKGAMAQYIAQTLGNSTYQPFEADVPGLPFIEVGDKVTFTVKDHITGNATQKQFVIMSRTLKGIQYMTDTFTAYGEKDQRIFVSDIGTHLDLIPEEDYSELEERIEDVEQSVEDLGGSVSDLGDSVSDLGDKTDKTNEDLDDLTVRVDALEHASPIGSDLMITSVRTVPTNPQDNVLYLIQGELIEIR